MEVDEHEHEHGKNVKCATLAWLFNNTDPLYLNGQKALVPQEYVGVKVHRWRLRNMHGSGNTGQPQTISIEGLPTEAYMVEMRTLHSPQPAFEKGGVIAWLRSEAGSKPAQKTPLTDWFECQDARMPSQLRIFLNGLPYGQFYSTHPGRGNLIIQVIQIDIEYTKDQ